MADKNKRSSASFVPFKPLDSLFEPTVQDKPQAGSISQISTDDLFPFKDHPFLPYTEINCKWKGARQNEWHSCQLVDVSSQCESSPHASCSPLHFVLFE